MAARAAAILVLAAMAGCAVQPRQADAVVREKAQARWSALVKGDTDTAYGFLSPGSRAVLSKQDYGASVRRGFWKSAAVEEVKCGAPDACEAQVALEYEYQGRKVKTPLRETWIREGSDWWYVQK